MAVFEDPEIMASTKLIRKARVNRARVKNRLTVLKQENFQPVIRKVDIEELKKEFES